MGPREWPRAQGKGAEALHGSPEPPSSNHIPRGGRPRDPETRLLSPPSLLHTLDRCGIGTPNWEAGDPGIPRARHLTTWVLQAKSLLATTPPFYLHWVAMSRTVSKGVAEDCSAPEWESAIEFHALNILVWRQEVEA